MKKILVAILLWLPVMLVAQKEKQVQYKISGNLSQVSDPVKKVVLSYSAGDNRIYDTTTVKNGGFQFTGKMTEPTRANLRLIVDSAEAASKGIIRKPVMPRDFLTVFLDKGNIDIITVDSFSNSKVKGSATHDEYAKLLEQLKPLNDEYAKISKQYAALSRAKDEEGMRKLEPKFDELDNKMKAINGEYVRTYPQSPYALFALTEFAGYEIDAKAVEPLFETLPANVRESASGKKLADKIAIAKKTGIGMYAIDFTQNDTANVPVQLSSFKGKFVLVDFWASWCGPCRAENPNVVKAFNKYKDKGFTILGVSLDAPGQKARWMKAIHDDQLQWTQVSDLMYWDNAAAKLYGIEAIPQNFLIDPSGKIIARSIRGEELEKKLQEVFQ